VRDYYEIIKQPMDFETIQKKLDIGFQSSTDESGAKAYQSVAEFSQDILRVFDNARQYN
jgi:hypothetical protein